MAQRQNTQDLKKVKLPFFNSYSNRNTDPEKDLRFLNCYPESKKTEQTDVTRTCLVKRPGLYTYKYFSDDPARGLAYFNGKLYAAYGSEIKRVPKLENLVPSELWNSIIFLNPFLTQVFQYF